MPHCYADRNHPAVALACGWGWFFAIATKMKFLFDNWMSLGRVLVIAPLAYFALIALLRISGNRTLSKMNAFDLVVTVALGSTLATVLLSKQVALLEGILAFAMLIGLQFAMTRLATRSEKVAQLIKAEPELLVLRGEMLPEAMNRQRVVEAEVLQAVREAGLESLQDVHALVLETDGKFSVIPSSKVGASHSDADSTLSNVRGPVNG